MWQSSPEVGGASPLGRGQGSQRRARAAAEQGPAAARGSENRPILWGAAAWQRQLLRPPSSGQMQHPPTTPFKNPSPPTHPQTTTTAPPGRRLRRRGALLCQRQLRPHHHAGHLQLQGPHQGVPADRDGGTPGPRADGCEGWGWGGGWGGGGRDPGAGRGLAGPATKEGCCLPPFRSGQDVRWRLCGRRLGEIERLGVACMESHQAGACRAVLAPPPLSTPHTPCAHWLCMILTLPHASRLHACSCLWPGGRACSLPILEGRNRRSRGHAWLAE